jgi:hypothetical protein
VIWKKLSTCTAAIADVRVRQHGFLQIDEQVGCSKEHPTVQMENFYEKKLSGSQI